MRLLWQCYTNSSHLKLQQSPLFQNYHTKQPTAKLPYSTFLCTLQAGFRLWQGVCSWVLDSTLRGQQRDSAVWDTTHPAPQHGAVAEQDAVSWEPGQLNQSMPSCILVLLLPA